MFLRCCGLTGQNINATLTWDRQGFIEQRSNACHIHRFWCLMAGATYSAGFLPLWLNSFCWVSIKRRLWHTCCVARWPFEHCCKRPIESLVQACQWWSICSLLEFSDYEKTHMHYYLRLIIMICNFSYIFWILSEFCHASCYFLQDTRW